MGEVAVLREIGSHIAPTCVVLWNLRYIIYVKDLFVKFVTFITHLFILLGVPLVLGILTSHFLPKVAEALKKPLQWLSIVIFIAMVVLSFGSNIEAFLKCIKYIFLVVLIHNALALSIGFGVGSAFKVPFRDRRTLTIETGIQNSGLGLALMLGTNLFAGFPPHGGMLVITAWWGIWHIISGLTVATIFNLTRRADV